jgi:hypothetical protein
MHAVADQMQSAAPPKCIHVRPECIGASPSTSKLMQGRRCPPPKSVTTKQFMHLGLKTEDGIKDKDHAMSLLCILSRHCVPRPYGTWLQSQGIVSRYLHASITDDGGHIIYIFYATKQQNKELSNACQDLCEPKNNSHQLQLPCPSREICTSFLISRMPYLFFHFRDDLSRLCH